ncbi:MAG TPA: hypothetical protein VK327_07180 [Candidatus Paceibacterota bacterium]|nr:hypothetical protein [Candidatus Paceibacterota bacterium]
MSEASDQRSRQFLKISGQFKLGALVTESSHPVTAKLSEVARRDIAEALGLLFQVDCDVVAKYREFAESGRAVAIKETVLNAIRNGGKIFFTGCGATGRLSIQLVSIWRDFWRSAGREDYENRAFSVMAGGDFALIKSVEGFEDFAAFGRKQIGDLGVSARDVVFAITEGGETSFVIGTAWKGVEAGGKVYFVYNNPDSILREYVQRSREVIDDSRIEKVNLTTGPMAITGSTRMQATSIQLCVMLTILEMVVRDLAAAGSSDDVPQAFLAGLVEMHATLRSPQLLEQLAKLVALEESVYRSGHRNNYFADRFGIDVLTDTTERSPTYCTPPFRRFDDAAATESWSFLFLPDGETPRAWERILQREPRCVEWTDVEICELAEPEKRARTCEIIRRISRAELMRFRIGLDGLDHRKTGSGDSAIGIVSETEKDSLLSAGGFHRARLEAARKAGAAVGLIYFGRDLEGVKREALKLEATTVSVPVPPTGFLLDGVTRAGVKMLLNALSTCTMVRMGRVMGNYMIWVVASNLKLIDRATRYIRNLTGLGYEESNRLLFEAVEYVEPRTKADQAHPPVVGLAVMRARHGISNEEAERRLMNGVE